VDLQAIRRTRPQRERLERLTVEGSCVCELAPPYGAADVKRFEVSADERLDERCSIDARLTKDPAQRASLDFAMEWHDASGAPSSEHRMAAPLANDIESEALKRADGLGPRDVREFRQRR
jgi:hypothetical protein